MLSYKFLINKEKLTFKQHPFQQNSTFLKGGHKRFDQEKHPSKNIVQNLILMQDCIVDIPNPKLPSELEIPAILQCNRVKMQNKDCELVCQLSPMPTGFLY